MGFEFSKLSKCTTTTLPRWHRCDGTPGVSLADYCAIISVCTDSAVISSTFIPEEVSLCGLGVPCCTEQGVMACADSRAKASSLGGWVIVKTSKRQVDAFVT